MHVARCSEFVFVRRLALRFFIFFLQEFESRKDLVPFPFELRAKFRVANYASHSENSPPPLRSNGVWAKSGVVKVFRDLLKQVVDRTLSSFSFTTHRHSGGEREPPFPSHCRFEKMCREAACHAWKVLPCVPPLRLRCFEFPPFFCSIHSKAGLRTHPERTLRPLSRSSISNFRKSSGRATPGGSVFFSMASSTATPCPFPLAPCFPDESGKTRFAFRVRLVYRERLLFADR